MNTSEGEHSESSAHLPSQVVASPSPSPALSAYSSTTSNSSLDNDYDLNALSLDDWGYPHRSLEVSTPDRSGRRNSPTYTLQAPENLDGTSTPIAKRHPLASVIHGKPSNLHSHSNSESNETTREDVSTSLEDDEEDEELETTGFDVEDEDEEDMHAHGVPAARGWRLKAK
jgi:hypothetical protein